MGGPSEIDPIVDAHLDWCRFRGLAESTITQRLRCLTRLAATIPGPLLLATHENLYAHLSRPLSVEARASEVSHLRQFYKWTVAEQYATTDPTARIRRPKVPRRLPRPISETDLEMALRFAPERVRPWLVLAGWCGLRAAEIAALRAEDIQWDHQVLIVRDAAKGGKHAAVPMCVFVVDELTGLPNRGWLFARHDDLPGPLPAHRVSQVANAYLHSLGIGDTIHQLRHRFGTHAYQASGRDLRVTQELLRHASPVSTAIYTWVDPRDTRATVDRIPVPV